MNGSTEENLNAEVIKNLVSGGGASNAGSSSENKSGSSSAGIIKTINKDIVIRTGQYGAYINYKNKHNIKIYSKKPIKDLDLDDCMAMIQKKFKKK